MGSALTFEIDGDATKLEASMLRSQAIIARTSQKVLREEEFGNRSLLDPEKSRKADVEQARRDVEARAIRERRLRARMQGPDLDGSMRLKDMMNPGGGGGHKSQFSAGHMQVIHSLRATFDSLVSGGNPLTIMMQQIPQFIQGFALMKGGVMDFVKELMKMPVGTLGTVTGVVSGLVIGFAAAYFHAKALVDKLSGIKMPDINPEYIAKHLQKMNAVAEAWKEVRKAVQETKDDYNSVAKNAERAAEASKKHFTHLRAMNEASTLSPRAKAEQSLRIDEQERAADIAAKRKEAADLETSAQAKMNAAEPILKTTDSKAQLDENLSVQRQRLKVMEDAATAVQDAKNEKGLFGITGRSAFRAYNNMTASPVTDTDLNKAEDQIVADRNTQRQHVKNLTNEAHDKEEELAKANKLKTDAQTEFQRAATLRGELTTDPAQAALANANARAEMNAKLAGQGGAAQLTEREKIGAGITGPAFTIQQQQLDAQKKMVMSLDKIQNRLDRMDSITNGGDTVNF